MNSNKNIYFINLLLALNIRDFLINLSLFLNLFRLYNFLLSKDLNKNIRIFLNIFIILLITKREELDLYEFTIIFVIASAILIEKKRVKRKFQEILEYY